MLTKCPECNLQISDKALSCPHCGYPLIPEIKRRVVRKSSKHRRLPNGFGQISEIKGRNLRKPFRAMVTVDKTEFGKPICKMLKPEAFFSTYNEAYEALLEYNKNPYDLDDSITIKELYAKWSKEYFDKLESKSGVRTITASWAYCSSVYNMRVADLRGRHIKYCMDEGKAIVRGKEQLASAGVKARIKSMFNLMLDYAVEYELVDRNYARSFNISKDIRDEVERGRTEHIPFTDEEMNILWEHVKRRKYVDMILIDCYSGWRPQELCNIKLTDVDLVNWTFTGGMKTEAGKNRVVPIHNRIRTLVLNKYNEARKLNSEYLFNDLDGKENITLTYDKWVRRFEKVRDMLHLNSLHRCHDCRIHFVTMAKKYQVDEYAIKYLVGHVINDITEAVYTKREDDWLFKEFGKIK